MLPTCRVAPFGVVTGEESKRRRPRVAHCPCCLQLGTVARRVQSDVAEMHGKLGRRPGNIFPHCTPVCSARGSCRRQMTVSYDGDAHGIGGASAATSRHCTSLLASLTRAMADGG